MKAAIYSAYGSADVIRVTEVNRPVPKDNEILVRVYETIVTPSDVAGRTGRPFLIRLFSGLTRPKGIPGSDFAGEVVAAGHAVTRFQVGQRVFGAVSPNTGTYAEYVCLPETGVVTELPAGIPFEATAGYCDAAMTALTFLRDVASLQAGQHVLINGASGAIGTYAIQIAKHLGARVTGVCSSANLGLVRSLGADAVIDYLQQDFAAVESVYDVVFDAVGKSSFKHCRGALKPSGIYLTTVPSSTILFQMLWTSVFGQKKARFAATGLQQNQEKLAFLKEMLLAGKLKAIVDRHYTLEEIAEAHRYVETGHKKGNLVILLAN